jgi:hypothetical protein
MNTGVRVDAILSPFTKFWRTIKDKIYQIILLVDVVSAFSAQRQALAAVGGRGFAVETDTAEALETVKKRGDSLLSTARCVIRMKLH